MGTCRAREGAVADMPTCAGLQPPAFGALLAPQLLPPSRAPVAPPLMHPSCTPPPAPRDQTPPAGRAAAPGRAPHPAPRGRRTAGGGGGVGAGAEGCRWLHQRAGGRGTHTARLARPQAGAGPRQHGRSDWQHSWIKNTACLPCESSRPRRCGCGRRPAQPRLRGQGPGARGGMRQYGRDMRGCTSCRSFSDPPGRRANSNTCNSSNDSSSPPCQAPPWPATHPRTW